MPAKPASDALKRFTVLDLTRVRAGPTCVRQLADWGANVIKIELPEAMESGNGLGGARHGPDFLNLHRNKRAMTLNLKESKGVDLLKRLVRKADVIVENYRPEVKERLGIDYDVLSKENPALVYASISGFGQDGPYAKRPGFDQIAQGMGGVMSITGLPGQGPVRAGIPIADLCAGLFAAQGIMIALLERVHTGADIDDDAGAFVPENGRKDALRVGSREGEGVGVAHPGGPHFNHNLALARAFDLNGGDFQRLAGLDGDGGSALNHERTP